MNNELFNQMFSEYCKSEIAKGHCASDDCEFCCVNQAWNRIFEYVEYDDDEE